MQKSEKTAEPSMEEILASIRKIIAEEPAQAPQPAAAEPVIQPTNLNENAEETAGPPGGDLSDILDEPSNEGTGPALPSSTDPLPSVLDELAAAAAKEQPSNDAKDLPIEAGKPLFAQTDAGLESPLMARLRGLSGVAGVQNETTEAKTTTDSAEAEPNAAEVEAQPAPVTPSAFKPVVEPQPEVEQKVEPLAPSNNEPMADAVETAFGKDATSGAEPVEISVDLASAIAPATSTTEPFEATEPQVSAEEPELEKTDEEQTKPAPAQIDNVFASLTTGPALEVPTDGQDLPVLPHQEIPDSKPEPSVVFPPAAVVDDPAPTEAHEPKSEAPAEPRADLEVALAALVQPIVHQWLADNVPALVEKALAENAKKQ